jgi:site-specific DNA-methyltransferase (adenine-specific)/adenine-specific DNA-methyltransferase
MPTLNWIGKDAVINHHLEVPFRLLKDVPDLGCGDPGSGNLIMEGDNLVALKALLPYYKGKVKCICIDPPYNTGNEGWAYNDNVNSPAIKKWLGEIVSKEGETLDRHDRWLCMMYPRLSLLREFLREDGAIFVHLDDNEAGHFRLMMGEIFGGANFVADILWQKRTSPDARLLLSDAHEHIFCFAKNHERLRFNKVPQSAKQRAAFKNPDNDSRGVWVSSDYAAQGFRQNQMYEITTPSGRKVKPPAGSCWKNIEDVFLKLVSENRIWFGKDGNGVPRRKTFLSESDGVSPWTWWNNDDVGHSQEAKKEVQDMFVSSGVIFDTPKPVRLIKRILQIATQPTDLVLDSFAGSGTTAHAVMNQNAEDGGNRRFILVEMDERIAQDITRERVKRVANGYTNSKGENVAGLGGGFRYVTLGDELFNEYGRINEDKIRFDDLARHVYFSETGEPLPKERISAKTPLLGSHHGRAVYLLYNGILKDKSVKGGNLLTSTTLEHLPRHDGPKVVYAAACRLSKARLEREDITFKQTPYAIRTS